MYLFSSDKLYSNASFPYYKAKLQSPLQRNVYVKNTIEDSKNYEPVIYN